MSHDPDTPDELLRELLYDRLPDRRERIATAALQGMLADSKWLVACREESARSGVAARRIMAESAVQYADALIAELDKETE